MYITSELTGKIYLNGIEIPLDDSTAEFQQYLNDKDIVGVDYVKSTPEEIAEANKPIVPNVARSMNFRLVLIQNGISMQSVYELIASLPSPQNELGYQMFEYATHYDRNNAMINGLAQMMGISQEQLDAFFIQSENLVV